MAEDATGGLLRLLAGETAGPMQTHMHELLVRESTAPPLRK